MCLNSRFATREEVLAHFPGDVAEGFKFLRKRGGQLQSPHYHFNWREGVLHADTSSRGNGDAGIYCFLVKPGTKLNSNQDERVLRLVLRKEDIVWAGRDSSHGKEGVCVVMSKVEILKEDLDKALSNEFQEIEAKALIETAKLAISEGVERVEASREEAETTVEVTKTAVKENPAEVEPGGPETEKTNPTPEEIESAKTTVKSGKASAGKAKAAAKKTKAKVAAKVSSTKKKLAKKPVKKPAAKEPVKKPVKKASTKAAKKGAETAKKAAAKSKAAAKKIVNKTKKNKK